MEAEAEEEMVELSTRRGWNQKSESGGVFETLPECMQSRLSPRRSRTFRRLSPH